MIGNLLSALSSRIRRWTCPRQSDALPFQLHRRRVYVLPTGFGLFYMGLVGTMALGALNYNNNPAFLLGLLLGGAGLASLIMAHLQLSGLRITAMSGEPVTAGKPMLVTLHARSDDGRSRHGLQVQVDAQQAVLSLDNGEGRAVLELPTSRRGWLALPPLTLSTRRPLGLARAWSHLWPDPPLLVYPAPESPAPPLPLHGQDEGRPAPRQQGDELLQLRDYRHGDSARLVAWKPSARHGSLLVREHEQPRGQRIELRWQDTAGLPGEQRIRRLTAWVEEAARKGLSWQLQLPAQPPLGPDSGDLHRHACLRALALLPVTI